MHHIIVHLSRLFFTNSRHYSCVTSQDVVSHDFYSTHCNFNGHFKFQLIFHELSSGLLSVQLRMYSLQLPPPFLQRLSSLSQSTEIAKPPRTEEPTLSLTLNSLRQRPAPQARTALYGSQARPPSTTLKKAPPTVFLTNASAVRTTISCCLLPSPSGLPESPAQNFIPFPTSTPIDFPPPRPPSDVVDPVPEIESANNQNCCTSTEAPKPGVSPVPVGQPEQRKRRLRSFLASSSSPTSSVKLPFKRAKVPKPKSTTKARKSRKQVADLHFMALMHRSIVWHMRTVRTSSMDIDSEESPRHETDSSCLFDQDTLLVERLWQSLIDKGLKPIITDSTYFDIYPARRVSDTAM